MRVTATIDIFALDAGTVERPAPGAAPTAFRIWKAGENPTDKGNTIFSPSSAKALMLAQAERGNLFSFDVDHLSLSPVAPPESRKAVGWHRLDVRSDENGNPELWAVNVEWTDVARVGLEKSPPEWRYFSPAYDVHPKSREVVGYLNTALTNNPATWGVTSLASRTEESMKMEDVLAALRAMAEGDDEQKEQAARMIRAAEGDEKDPEGGGEAPKEDATDEKDAADADDDEKDTKASIAASKTTDPLVLELATVVQSMRSELDSMKKDREGDERARLLASRADFAPELRAVLQRAPLVTVRDAVKRLPLATKRDPAAPARVQSTRGDTQGESRASRLPPEEKRQLDEQMGLSRRTDSIRREGSRVLFGVMTRDDAARRPATKAEA